LDISHLFLTLQKGLKLIKAMSAVLTVRVEQNEDLASFFHLFDDFDGILETSVETCTAQVSIFIVDSLKILLLGVGF